MCCLFLKAVFCGKLRYFKNSIRSIRLAVFVKMKMAV